MARRAATGSVSDELVRRAEAYLATALEHPDLQVSSASRIPGGASRETWMVAVTWDSGAGGDELVLRLDPGASVLDSKRLVEFELYRRLGRLGGLPLPEALLIEHDPTHLGTTFFVMRRVPGASRVTELHTPGREVDRQAIARQQMRDLGTIATLDWRAIGLDTVIDVPDDPAAVWDRELTRWEHVVEADEIEPQVVTHAAIRALRRSPPPPPQRISLVHGDFRSGNFLFEGGAITAYLDWELAHLGDPLEDLGWACARPWRQGQAVDGLVGSLMTRAEAVERWQEATGLDVDDRALRWWELFAMVKLNAIFFTGAHQFVSGRSAEPLMAMMSWVLVNRQEGWMLDALEELR